MVMKTSVRKLLASLLCVALLVSTTAVGGLNVFAASQTLYFENPALSQKYAAEGTTDNTVNSQAAVRLATQAGNTFMEFSYAAAPTFMPGFRVKAESDGSNITFDNTAGPYYKIELKHMAKAIAADATVELRLYWGSCRWSDLLVADANSKRDYKAIATYTAADMSPDWSTLTTLVQFTDSGVSDYFGNGIHFAVYVKSGTAAGNVVRVDDITLTPVAVSELITVTLEPGAGTLTQTSLVGLAGDTVTLPVPTAPMAFTGWQDAAGLTLTDADPAAEGFQYVLVSATTLQATYTINTCVLTLDPNDGTLGDSTTVLTGEVGAPITLPAAPVREGFAFTGWVDESGAPVGDTYPAGSFTVYASWEPTGSYTTDAAVQTFEEEGVGTEDFYLKKFTAVSDFTNHTAGGDKALKTTIRAGDNSQRDRPRLVLKTGDANTADNYAVEAGARYTITLYVKPAVDTDSITGYVAVISDPAANIDKIVNPGGNDCHRLQDGVMWSVNDGSFVTAREIQNVSLTGGKWNKLLAIVPAAVLHDADKENYLSIGLTDFDSHTGMPFAPYDLYIDDISVTRAATGADEGGATMDMENLADRPGADMDIRDANGHTATVAFGENHTENGQISLLINDTTSDSGNERAQIILTDGSGHRVTIEAGKQYTLSFWFKLREGSKWLGNENGIRFWLVTSRNGEKITDSTADGVKNRYKVYETGDDSSVIGVEGEWVPFRTTFTAENLAGDVSGDLVLGIASFHAAGSFWLDDILIEEIIPPAFDPQATVQDLEIYADGAEDFSLHQTNKVSGLYNHTEGGQKSLEITNNNWSGSDRNQIVLLSPATGQPWQVEIGKEYLLSFWVYLPPEADSTITLNVWLATVDDATVRIEDKNAANCEVDDGGVAAGSQIPVGEWTKVARHFVPQNGTEVVVGLCDSLVQHSNVKYYIDDLTLSAPQFCTVTLEGNGRSGPIEPIRHVADTTLENLPEPVRPGYEFVGWCWDVEGQYPFLPSTVSEDITLYAAWIADDGYVYEEESPRREEDSGPEYEIIQKWERVPKDPDEIVEPVFDVGERPVLEAADAILPQPEPDVPVAEKDGLPSWAIILIILAAVVVVGGGGLTALFLLKRKTSDGEKEVA